ncbi:hypothetical protein H5T58_01515, partial [Candidatus Parcubacteria bacterium]|nr:hypothetical protein [Candidatus Parcubacteria bacterium]
MKLKILKEKLERGLNLAEKIPTKKLSLPILENVLLETKENYFKVVTTNLESALLWWSLAKIEKEGKICVPKKLFSDTIAKIQANILDLSQKENFFLIETETLNVKLKTYDPSEFPIIPQPSENLVCEIPAENLILGIKKVYNFVAQSLSRPEIAGILISFQGDTIKFVATDSFRLGEKKLPLGKEIPNPVSFILPQSAAKE